MQFSDHIAAVAAMRAAGRPFAFAWNNGNHSGGDIMLTTLASYTADMFEIGRGYPHLTNSSRDQDPAVDLVGGINVGFKWRNVVESAAAWSCELYNNQATTVTVKPHSTVFSGAAPKIVALPAATWVTVTFAAAPPPPLRVLSAAD